MKDSILREEIKIQIDCAIDNSLHFWNPFVDNVNSSISDLVCNKVIQDVKQEVLLCCLEIAYLNLNKLGLYFYDGSANNFR